MTIKFKDGKEIEFKKCGNVWLAESVIWENTELHDSLNELRELKIKITQWFKENASKELSDNFNARLPLWKEIEPLSFKDQVAYREEKTNQMADYFLGDEDCSYPLYSHVGYSIVCEWLFCYPYHGWRDGLAIRLCLEEK